jgi:hypothetical protein
MQSRRRDKRAPTLPLVLLRDGVKEVVQVPRTQYPTYLATPLFPPPGIFWSGKPVRGVFANLEMIHLCGPTFQQASKDYPGADFVGAHTNFSAEDFPDRGEDRLLCSRFRLGAWSIYSHSNQKSDTRLRPLSATG